MLLLFCRYKENMKKLSKLYKDQPQTPLERGVFWVEYVLRNGGAHHLNLPTRDMSFLQTGNLDVIIFLIVSISVVILILLKLTFGIIKYFKKSTECGRRKLTKNE